MNETIVGLLISVLGFVIARYIIPFINAKTTEAQRDNVEFWVKLAISTAEKVYENQTGVGLDKKAYVINFLKSKHINITDEELNVLIEGLLKEIEKYK